MSIGHLAESLTAIMATYLVHSSAFLLVALVLDRALGHHRVGLSLALWRTALLGPLLTVLLQGALIDRPLGGTLELFAAPEHSAPTRFTHSSPCLMEMAGGGFVGTDLLGCHQQIEVEGQVLEGSGEEIIVDIREDPKAIASLP